jgi:molecular chaperone GrpE (heat shock protein)
MGESEGARRPPSEEHIRDLREALEHERRTSAELRTQNRELQSQLMKLAAEMQAVVRPLGGNLGGESP